MASCATLHGWAGIEDHLAKHDSSTMRDYADDIDTLLVFVRLIPSVRHQLLIVTLGCFVFGHTDDFCS